MEVAFLYEVHMKPKHDDVDREKGEVDNEKQLVRLTHGL